MTRAHKKKAARRQLQRLRIIQEQHKQQVSEDKTAKVNVEVIPKPISQAPRLSPESVTRARNGRHDALSTRRALREKLLKRTQEQGACSPWPETLESAPTANNRAETVKEVGPSQGTKVTIKATQEQIYDPVVLLDARGTIMSTRHSTLERAPKGSTLSRIAWASSRPEAYKRIIPSGKGVSASPHTQQQQQQQERVPYALWPQLDGSYFVDINPRWMTIVLDYLAHDALMGTTFMWNDLDGIRIAAQALGLEAMADECVSYMISLETQEDALKDKRLRVFVMTDDDVRLYQNAIDLFAITAELALDGITHPPYGLSLPSAQADDDSDESDSSASDGDVDDNNSDNSSSSSSSRKESDVTTSEGESDDDGETSGSDGTSTHRGSSGSPSAIAEQQEKSDSETVSVSKRKGSVHRVPGDTPRVRAAVVAHKPHALRWFDTLGGCPLRALRRLILKAVGESPDAADRDVYACVNWDDRTWRPMTRVDMSVQDACLETLLTTVNRNMVFYVRNGAHDTIKPPLAPPRPVSDLSLYTLDMPVLLFVKSVDWDRLLLIPHGTIMARLSMTVAQLVPLLRHVVAAHPNPRARPFGTARTRGGETRRTAVDASKTQEWEQNGNDLFGARPPPEGAQRDAFIVYREDGTHGITLLEPHRMLSSTDLICGDVIWVQHVRGGEEARAFIGGYNQTQIRGAEGVRGRRSKTVDERGGREWRSIDSIPWLYRPPHYDY